MRDAIKIHVVLGARTSGAPLGFDSDAFDAESILDNDGLINTLREETSELVVLHGLSLRRRDEVLEELHSEKTTSVMPVLMLSEHPLPQGVCSDAYDALGESATPQEIEAKALGLLARRGRLHTLIQKFDATAAVLTSGNGCEWVRCGTGIIGLVTLPHKQPTATLSNVVRKRVVEAHGLLESQPESVFNTDDAWNLILLISVAWTSEEAKADNSEQALLDLEKDLTASRKVVLWRSASPVEHIGPLARASSGAVAIFGEPAVEAIEAAAVNDRERVVLRALLKRRIPEDDLEAIIEALGGSIDE